MCLGRFSYPSSSFPQKVTYIATPSRMAMNHMAIVGFMSFLLPKQVLRSVLKCHEAASQMPSTTAMNPSATWVNEIMTIASSASVPGEVKKVLKEGIIT